MSVLINIVLVYAVGALLFIPISFGAFRDKKNKVDRAIFLWPILIILIGCMLLYSFGRLVRYSYEKFEEDMCERLTPDE